jgi:hypothetical protein
MPDEVRSSFFTQQEWDAAQWALSRISHGLPLNNPAFVELASKIIGTVSVAIGAQMRTPAPAPADGPRSSDG